MPKGLNKGVLCFKNKGFFEIIIMVVGSKNLEPTVSSLFGKIINHS